MISIKFKYSKIFHKFKSKFIIIKYSLIFIIVIVIILILNNNTLINKKKNNKFISNIINIHNNSNLFENSFKYKKLGINYLNKCKRSISNNITKISDNTMPTFSIIIPVFNCQTTIELSIISILNQKFMDFEIVLVNDFSSDNSLQKIINIQKNDKRIKILNNKRNMGTLYSRCIGTLKSKGTYIIPLDNDDLFMSDILFENIYKINKYYDFDIIEFKSFQIKNYNPNINDLEEGLFNHHLNNIVVNQPELSLFPISKNNKYAYNDFWIWDKCIKSKIYKKSIKSLGKKRFSIYNCWTEDISMVFIIFSFAQSCFFFDFYGVFHILATNTASNILNFNHKLYTEIFLLDIIFDFSKNNEKNKKYAVYKALEIANNNIYILNLKEQMYLKYIIKKLLKSKYIILHLLFI